IGMTLVGGTPIVITPFTLVGNALLTAPDSDSDAANARNGVGSRVDNNDFDMVSVDVDGVPSTANSSRASLSLPAGAVPVVVLLEVGQPRLGAGAEHGVAGVAEGVQQPLPLAVVVHVRYGEAVIAADQQQHVGPGGA